MNTSTKSCRIIAVLILLSLTFISSSFADPEAETFSSPRCNTFTFDATGSNDPDDEAITYLWEFGDGTTSTEAIIAHTYTKSGNYDVKLTVTDSSGLQCSKDEISQTITASIPPTASFVSPDLICANDANVFDASGSYDESKGKLNYDWDFGDGVTDKEKKITKTYAKGGTYKVRLTVDDGKGAACSSASTYKSIIVNEPPIADAGEEEILKCVSEDNDLNVSFDASNSHDSNNDQLSYAWDFGDGTMGTDVKTSHQYKELGNYDVKLVVKDSTDIGCGTNVDFVRVRLNKAPKADAGEDLVACAGDPINFDGEKSDISRKGTVISEWNFGDGTTARGVSVMHSYEKPGQYQATLELSNELNKMCAPSRDTRNVTVNATPIVAIQTTASICLGSSAFFDATSASDADGDNLIYYWSFGDGEVLESGPKVSHDYKQGGKYKVSVVVDDGKGTKCSTATASKEIIVNTPPVANAGPNLTCCTDKESSFDASGSTDPDNNQLKYTWDFGDGTSAEGIKSKHSYSKSGSYNVTLTVDDNTGSACSTATAGFTSEVNGNPKAVISVR